MFGFSLIPRPSPTPFFLTAYMIFEPGMGTRLVWPMALTTYSSTVAAIWYFYTIHLKPRKPTVLSARYWHLPPWCVLAAMELWEYPCNGGCATLRRYCIWPHSQPGYQCLVSAGLVVCMYICVCVHLCQYKGLGYKDQLNNIGMWPTGGEQQRPKEGLQRSIMTYPEELSS